MKKLLLVCLLAQLPLASRADEGMWLFNQPPREMLRERYRFDVTEEWLDHLRKASIRFNSGGSGSFISHDGLLISNHHVGADALQKLSAKDKNYLRDGFFAQSMDQEIKCLDLELNVLESIEDVTARVNAAVPKEAEPGAAFAARRRIIAEIEKESQDQTGLRSDVVTLWQGGAYHLYRYKRYTDVRLVFAPEQQTAFYGGDPDNFEFPRYDLDVCLFRAYENGQPVHPADYLRFSREGPHAGDLVFVSGNPGRTSRLLTVAELKELRDQAIPFRLTWLKDREVLLESWSARNDENARRAKEILFGVKNSRKAYDGRLAGLLSPTLMQGKEKVEEDFKLRLEGKPEWADALKAYRKIEEAVHILQEQEVKYNLLEGGLAFNADCFRLARTLLRAGDEQPKPNGGRLREYSESGRASMELALFSTKPIYPDLEALTLADSLTFLANELGADDPLLRQVLGGKSPRQRARDLIDGTKVRDAAWRKRLYEGGASAVAAAQDPMIELARLVDADARSLRAVNETQTEVKNQAHAALARAHNALEGSSGYPDATFTLRLAFGAVKGYEQDGETVAPFTTFAGLFSKAAEMKNRPPFDLTPMWGHRKASVKTTTPFDFVCTADIIGGNSGSPVVDRAGNFVGIIFDGNLASLPWDFAFEDREGRAVAVDSTAIL